MSKTILHITSRETWKTAQEQGRYTSPSLTSDGFIHCSTRAQVLPVAEKFYKGQTGLVLLVIDSTRLSSELKWEPPFDGAPPAGKMPAPSAGVPVSDIFPHVYGPINLDAVVQIIDFEPTAEGKFILPKVP
jgi:uncharacterized protein (DUF952 family)